MKRGDATGQMKTFKYRLYPSKCQKILLEETVETCRRFYNDCLAERRDAYEQRQETIGKYAQLRKVKVLKETNPHAKSVHSHIFQVVVADLDKAFQAFFRRVRSGEKPGYPRFKGRNRFNSLGLKEYGNGFRIDGRRLKLSGIGRVAVRWHRPIEGKIRTVRLTRKTGHWYACFTCEVRAHPLPATDKTIGIDVGISSIIVTSNGERVGNPKWYRTGQAKIRRCQRKVARRKKDGSNRRKSVRLLQRQHERIRNRRKDFLDKLAHKLIAENGAIAIEDLRIGSMVGNRYLSKSIMDAGWRYFRQRLEAKAVEAGRTIVFVDPRNTTKICSRCGGIVPKTLSQRVHDCPNCGLVLDRDHNAALNILRLGQGLWASTYPATDCVAQEAAGFDSCGVSQNRNYVGESQHMTHENPP